MNHDKIATTIVVAILFVAEGRYILISVIDSPLSLKRIAKLAQSAGAFTRGREYYTADKVRSLDAEADESAFSTKVKGTLLYNQHISFNREYKVIGFECDCPAYAGFNFGACKHVVAALLAIRRWLAERGRIVVNDDDDGMNPTDKQRRKKSDTAPSDWQTLELINKLSDTSAADVRVERTTPSISVELVLYYRVEPALINEYDCGAVYLYTLVEGRKQRVKDIARFVQFVQARQESLFELDDERVLSSEHVEYTENSVPIITWLRAMAADVALSGSAIRLTPYWHNMLLETAIHAELEVGVASGYYGRATLADDAPQLMLKLVTHKYGARLAAAQDDQTLIVINEKYGYLLTNGRIHKVDETLVATYKIVSQIFHSAQGFFVSGADIGSLLGSLLPSLKRIAVVDTTAMSVDKYLIVPLECSLWCEAFGQGIRARLLCHYGDISFNPHLLALESHDLPENLLRDRAAERAMQNVLLQQGFVAAAEGAYQLTSDERIYDFVKHGLATLSAIARVHVDEQLMKLRPRAPHAIRTGARLAGNLLDIDVEYASADKEELIALLAALQLKKRFIRVKSGEFVELDDARLRELSELLTGIHADPASLVNGHVTVPKRMALYVDEMANSRAALELQRDAQFDRLISAVRSPIEFDAPVPDGIQASLRGYQITGYKWLCALAEYGFGGILADDMGLGKTLQAILLIAASFGKQRTQSLIVTPASLTYNWLAECDKFAPHLRVIVVDGNAAQRAEKIARLQDYDVAITTYGILRSDAQKYANIKFRYCFLDEAQHIKNPATLSAKAVKSVCAESCFALTGTPIENTLTELWSIFDFLMPDYLYTHSEFFNRFERPLLDGDKQAADELRKKIGPFVMRRLKKDVLSELPAKIESVSWNEMTAPQRKLYAAHLAAARRELDETIAQKGYSGSGIHIIALLMRMRQICCHPALFVEGYKGGSGKLTQLRELIEDSLSGGHRVLLFSQFTSMLAIIRPLLDEAGVQYFYLDGSTKSSQRLDICNRFNSGEKQMALISLRAGGTGLNLTGADVVIHYDPWWNPAVEDQATDRAHRIGQENVVQVYKMLTKDTIEEKIFELQQRKRALIDTVIQSGETLLSKLSEDEVRALFE